MCWKNKKPQKIINGKLVNTEYAEVNNEYRKQLIASEESGKCIFCPAGLKKINKIILHEEGEWIITENDWPYKNSKKHLLIIGKEHKSMPQELTLSDWDSIDKLEKWAIKEYNMTGGGLCGRFGEDSGVTIKHIHFHLFSIKKKPRKEIVIRFLGLKITIWPWSRKEIIWFPIG